MQALQTSAPLSRALTGVVSFAAHNVRLVASGTIHRHRRDQGRTLVRVDPLVVRQSLHIRTTLKQLDQIAVERHAIVHV
ncbi:MAG: hypothetical protein AAFX39_03965 [Pseudomonadota bacterium]